MGWGLGLSHLCVRPLYIRYDEPVAPTDRSRAAATWSAVTAGVEGWTRWPGSRTHDFVTARAESLHERASCPSGRAATRATAAKSKAKGRRQKAESRRQKAEGQPVYFCGAALRYWDGHGTLTPSS